MDRRQPSLLNRRKFALNTEIEKRLFCFVQSLDWSPVGAAAAGGEVVRLLLGVGGVERGGRAGTTLPDHVHLDHRQSHHQDKII